MRCASLVLSAIASVGVAAAGCGKDSSSSADAGDPGGGGGAAAGGAGGGSRGGAGGGTPGSGGGAGGGGADARGGGGGAAGSGGAGGGAGGAAATPDGGRGPDTGAAADAPRASEAGTPAGGTAAAGNTCPAGPFGAPLPQNAMAAMVRGGYTFVEGPVWIASQKAFYFSEFSGTGTNGRIHKYTPADNRIAVFVDNVGTNGLAVDEKGMIVAASHDMQRLTRFDPATGMRTQVAGGDMYMGRPFNSVNDVVVRADGNIYFTDPTYQRGPRQGQDETAYYRLSPAGAVTRIGVVPQPNGISLSPDGRSLYVASSNGGPLRRYTLAADGSAMGGPTSISQLGSDGMAVDCAGNIYLTTQMRVIVLGPNGQMVGEVTGFSSGTTNAAFGGDDGRTLLVTAGRAVYQIRLNVPGLPN